MDAVNSHSVRFGALEIDEAKFSTWQALREKAEKFRERGEEVPTEIRTQILILEGASEGEATYLTQFSEEVPEPAQRMDAISQSTILAWPSTKGVHFYGGGVGVEIWKELIETEYANFPSPVSGSIVLEPGELSVVWIENERDVRKHLQTRLIQALHDVVESHDVPIAGRHCQITHRCGHWSMKDSASISLHKIRLGRGTSAFIPDRLIEPA